MTTLSLLDQLKASKLSDRARKRGTRKNPSYDAKQLKPPRSTHNPNNDTAANRVKQYSREPFVLSGGKLLPGL